MGEENTFDTEWVTIITTTTIRKWLGEWELCNCTLNYIIYSIYVEPIQPYYSNSLVPLVVRNISIRYRIRGNYCEFVQCLYKQTKNHTYMQEKNQIWHLFFLNTCTNSINNDYTNTLLIKFRGTIFYAYFLLTVNCFECVDEYCKHCCRWLILCFELNKEQKCEVRYVDNKLRWFFSKQVLTLKIKAKE